jgi:hypothetical protein
MIQWRPCRDDASTDFGAQDEARGIRSRGTTRYALLARTWNGRAARAGVVGHTPDHLLGTHPDRGAGFLSSNRAPARSAAAR